MLVSRLLPATLRSSLGKLRSVKNVAGGGLYQLRSISTTPARAHAPWTYRSFAPPDQKFERLAEICGAFMWWWIFWHLFTDYDHLIGHHPFPDIAAWTDEELGIPPDDADDPQ